MAKIRPISASPRRRRASAFPSWSRRARAAAGAACASSARSDELAAALHSARAEAKSAFGDGRLLLERALVDARHVEVQVFGDEHGAIVHLGERDCSIQRRHQKVIEEAPSPAVSQELRERMGAAAVQAARAVGYVGAGTVEFLLGGDGAFYFLEMNTRIQVEHPVTECVTGIDLVRLQLDVAQGKPLPFSQEDIALRGHAIEARLYAEDPSSGFMPRTGRILAWRPGAGEGVRVDHGLREGAKCRRSTIRCSPRSSLIGADREQARRRLLRALKETFLAGVDNNRAFLIAALERQDFVDGAATTAFIGESTPFAARRSRFARSPSRPSSCRERRRRLAIVVMAANAIAARVRRGESRGDVRRSGDEWLVASGGESATLRLIDRGGDEVRLSATACCSRRASRVRATNLTLLLDGIAYDFVDRTYAPPVAATTTPMASSARQSAAFSSASTSRPAIVCGADRRWRRSRR